MGTGNVRWPRPGNDRWSPEPWLIGRIERQVVVAHSAAQGAHGGERLAASANDSHFERAVTHPERTERSTRSAVLKRRGRRVLLQSMDLETRTPVLPRRASAQAFRAVRDRRPAHSRLPGMSEIRQGQFVQQTACRKSDKANSCSRRYVGNPTRSAVVKGPFVGVSVAASSIAAGALAIIGRP